MSPLKSAKKWQCNIRLFTGYGLSGFYIDGITQEEHSYINIPFRFAEARLESEFVSGAAALGFLGLLGHRPKAGDGIQEDANGGDWSVG